MQYPKSRYGYGRQKKERTPKELNELATAFFDALILPTNWKVGVRWSVGKIYRDMNTSGFALKDYRVFWETCSERGGIVEKTQANKTKPYHCICSNMTAERLNEFIRAHFISQEPRNNEESENKLVSLKERIQTGNF